MRLLGIARSMSRMGRHCKNLPIVHLFQGYRDMVNMILTL